MLYIKDIENRLKDLDDLIIKAQNEKQQLLGYAQCLKDKESDEQVSKSDKGPGPKVRPKAD